MGKNQAKEKGHLLSKKKEEEEMLRFKPFLEDELSSEEVKVLVNEVHIFRQELEMQNDELQVSYGRLDDERSKFVSLYDLAPVGYFILDYLGVITDVNERGVDLLKMSKESVIFKRFQSFITPDSWEHFYNFLHKIQKSGSRQSMEIKLQHNNNRVSYVRVEGIAVEHAIMAQIRYYIAVIDLTEIKHSQMRLQETKERLEMTLSASSTGIWTISSEDNKVYLDDFSYAILDLQPWEFTGRLQQFISFIHPDDQEKVGEALRSGFGANKEIDIEFRIVTKDGMKYIASKGHEVATDGKDGRCFAGILMDISVRKGLEKMAEELRNDQQRLILSTTLMAQEKERSEISSALHDSICQLLYAIRLNLQNYQIKNGLTTEFVNVGKLLEQAIRETRQISYELTPSVLKDFGFTAGVKEMAQRLASPSFFIKTNIQSAADLLHPKVQLYLFRIIQELINNAMKHSEATRAEIKVSIHSDFVKVNVSDNGKGFSEPIDELFKHGSGLRGIKNRVFLLDGKIDFKSDANGTSIIINFRKDVGVSDI